MYACVNGDSGEAVCFARVSRVSYCIVLYCIVRRSDVGYPHCDVLVFSGSVSGFTNAYTRVPLDSLHPPFAGYPSPCRDSTPWGLLTLYNYGSYCYRSVTVLTAKIKSVLDVSMGLLVYLNIVLQAGSVTRTRLGVGLRVMMYSYLNVCVCKWGRW